MRRKFTEKTKEEVFNRDTNCQLCGSYMAGDIHHCFSGVHLPKDWKKGEDINGNWNGVLLCKDCHTAMHHNGYFFNGKLIKENREYLENLAEQRYENHHRQL